MTKSKTDKYWEFIGDDKHEFVSCELIGWDEQEVDQKWKGQPGNSSLSQ